MGKFAEYTLLDIVTCTEYYIKNSLTHTDIHINEY